LIKKGELRWFGHVEHKADADWIKDRSGKNQTKGTSEEGTVGWYQGGYEEIWSLPRGCVVSEKRWKRKINGHSANPGSPGTCPLN